MDETSGDTPNDNDSDPTSNRFTEEEQLSLTMLPSLIGSAVAFSAKSGAVGTAKEMMANAKAAVAGQQEFPGNEIIKSILPNMDDAGAALEKAKVMREKQIERLKSAEIGSMEDMKGHALTQAAAVRELLASKADSVEAADYKEWVIGIANSVANAAKEGGFLGIGGERVSEGEEETLAAIKDALQE